MGGPTAGTHPGRASVPLGSVHGLDLVVARVLGPLTSVISQRPTRPSWPPKVPLEQGLGARECGVAWHLVDASLRAIPSHSWEPEARLCTLAQPPPGCVLGKASLLGVLRIRRASLSNSLRGASVVTTASTLTLDRTQSQSSHFLISGTAFLSPPPHPVGTTRWCCLWAWCAACGTGIHPALTPPCLLGLGIGLQYRPGGCLVGTLPWPTV